MRTSWRFSFIATGAIGFLWVSAFLLFQRLHPAMAVAEREMAAGPAPRGLAWSELLRYRQTWAVFVCRFLADPLWYFYVFWIPEFLTRERGLNLAAIGAVAWIPFLAADLSNFTGGYITLRMQRAGWTPNRTRKTMMAIAALASPVGIFAVFAHSLFWTIGLISIAVFFWMFWSISVHTLPGDYFPPRAVASVYGIAGTGSTVGSVISTWAVGKTLDLTHSYAPVFIGIGVLMPFAMLIGFSLMKKVEPVKLPA
jgi:ACS family hexuronate transporter-like MFS transporter